MVTPNKASYHNQVGQNQNAIQITSFVRYLIITMSINYNHNPHIIV